MKANTMLILLSMLIIRNDQKFEHTASAYGNAVRKHFSDNERFSDRVFIEDICKSNQHMWLFGVRDHCQNSASERAIRTIVESARIMLLCRQRLWLEAMSQAFWPFTISHVVCMHKHLYHDPNAKTPNETFSSSKHFFGMLNIHTFRSPACVLDHRFQNG